MKRKELDVPFNIFPTTSLLTKYQKHTKIMMFSMKRINEMFFYNSYDGKWKNVVQIIHKLT